MGSLFVAILLLIIIVSVFYKNKGGDDKEVKENDVATRLKQLYLAALKGSDKEQALTYGREYYAYLRNSRTLSAADEQTIANDLANMESAQRV